MHTWRPALSSKARAAGLLAAILCASTYCALSAAAEATIPEPCGGSSALEAIECMTPAWAADEAELNRAYTAARAKLRALKADQLERQLVQAQREWIRFREAHCRFSADMQVEGNAWNAFWYSSCLASEAKTRTEFLLSFEP